ncbi:UDP-galactose transporter 1 [Venturia nashicola]|nr:UDP-galactose transporter 1 [Venturia nashicola]
MNPQAIFDEFECKFPPRLLWRVNDRVSQAHREAEHCLTTTSQLEPITIKEFKEAIENHFNWTDRTKASCFRSVFSNKCDARDWALDRLESLQRKYTCREDGLRIVRLEIDSANLMETTWIFNAEELVVSLDLKAKTLPGEYLVYLDIPNKTAVARSGICEMRNESINHHNPKTPDKSFQSLLDHISVAEDAGNDADDELSGERYEDSKGEVEEDISHHGRAESSQSTTHNTIKIQDLTIGHG